MLTGVNDLGPENDRQPLRPIVRVFSNEEKDYGCACQESQTRPSANEEIPAASLATRNLGRTRMQLLHTLD